MFLNFVKKTQIFQRYLKVFAIRELHSNAINLT